MRFYLSMTGLMVASLLTAGCQIHTLSNPNGGLPCIQVCRDGSCGGGGLNNCGCDGGSMNSQAGCTAGSSSDCGCAAGGQGDCGCSTSGSRCSTGLQERISGGLFGGLRGVSSGGVACGNGACGDGRGYGFGNVGAGVNGFAGSGGFESGGQWNAGQPVYGDSGFSLAGGARDGFGRGMVSQAGGMGIEGCGQFGCGMNGRLCLGCRMRGAFGGKLRGAAGHARGLTPRGAHPYGGGIPHTDYLGAGVQPQAGQTPTYAYPYYTLRGPRDFLQANPPSIGW